jgi:hypothetical protein
MGLFKNKMKDQVKGSAEVLNIQGGIGGGGAYGGTSIWAKGTMSLRVTADGVSPIVVEWQGQVRCKYCPFEGQTIPITVDRTDPQNISIEWSELPTREEVRDQRAAPRRRQQELLAKMREGGELEQEGQQLAEKTKRLLEQHKSGAITDAEFAQEAKRLKERFQ